MKILLVCKGNATKRRTWSGVPFLVARRLRESGNEVLPFNVFDDLLFHWVGAAWNRLHDWKRQEFESTRIGGWLLRRAVIKKIKATAGVDRVIALTFSLDARDITVPVELMHDWTLGYFWKREDAEERRVLERMRRATAVLCFYPASTRYLVSHGVDARFVGLPVDPEAMGEGKRLYKENRAVIFAAANHSENFQAVLEDPRLLDEYDAVDVIGCEGENDGRFVFHGYLNKDVETDRCRYWEILRRASACIAMGRTWPGGSSIAEAKACGCRIVTREWPDLQAILTEEGISGCASQS